jgi:tetratricopeptide (TPR) repeat protein
MTRLQAADVVQAHGGEWVPRVTKSTTLLVVGQEGSPLDRDGRVARKIQKARSLARNSPIEIISESAWLSRLGLEARAASIRRLSTAQLCNVLGIAGHRLRRWVEWGLIKPVATVQGIHYFDFGQVNQAKTLCDLVEAGVTPDRIRTSLHQLRQWLPSAEESLAQLALLERDGELLVRVSEGGLADASGQLTFEFGEESAVPVVAVAAEPMTAVQWAERAIQQEEAGNWPDALDSYRQALLLDGPDAHICFSVANVLSALGQKDAAAERFRQAVELDGTFAPAWNNLGTVLEEAGKAEEAKAAYEQALKADRFYGDAHYNLADLLDKLGRPAEAVSHWQAYLMQEQAGLWADYARRRLAKNA